LQGKKSPDWRFLRVLGAKRDKLPGEDLAFRELDTRYAGELGRAIETIGRLAEELGRERGLVWALK
jgi:hypothetical protein